jgi:hypothetical protein
MSLEAPIFNALHALMQRLTPERGNQLDALDAPVSSRAPASSALSTATWTGARAVALDTIQPAYTHFSHLFGRADTLDFLVANPSLTPANFATWASGDGALTQLTVLLSHPAAAAILFGTPAVVAALAAHAGAMAIVAASPVAVAALVANSAAMATMAASSLAMTALMNSPATAEALWCNVASSTAIFASSTAMAAVAASSMGLSILARSAAAMAGVAASTTALTALFAVGAIRTALWNSTIACDALLTTTNAVDFLTGISVTQSTTAMAAVTLSASPCLLLTLSGVTSGTATAGAVVPGGGTVTANAANVVQRVRCQPLTLKTSNSTYSVSARYVVMA